jgi:ribosomal protein S1
MLLETFKELLEQSQEAKKGLTFYVGGQTIAGYVLRIRDDGAVVEVRNQTNSCIAIRMDRVDAIAAS